MKDKTSGNGFKPVVIAAERYLKRERAIFSLGLLFSGNAPAFRLPESWRFVLRCPVPALAAMAFGPSPFLLLPA